MKKSLSDLYEQMLLGEAEKNSLQNPSNDEVGKLPSENMFGTVPNTIKNEGPEKATLKKGPSYNKIDTGTSVSPNKEKNSTFPKSKPAKNPNVEDGLEMEEEDVVPDPEEMETETEKTFKPKKNKPQEESFNMSAFEELFKKTLNEQTDDEPTDIDLESEDSMDPDMADEADEADDAEEGEEGEEEGEETEEDLISDLKSLQDKLNSILSKLENLETDEEEEQGQEYSEEDFDGEFAEEDEEEDMDEDMDEEMPVKESKQSGLKPVNKSKIKTLQHKNNKVGKLSPKGGKAKGNNIKVTPNPKALGDKKKSLQSGSKAKSSVEKGEFFK